MSPSGCSRSPSRRNSWRYCKRRACSALLLAACGTRAAAQSSIETELRHNTQALLDAIAPGDTATWNRLLDPRVLQGDVVVARQGRPDRTFVPESPDVFFEPGAPRTRRMFQRDAQGQVTGFVDRREARDVVWKRIGS
jgi:hypothetical protein